MASGASSATIVNGTRIVAKATPRIARRRRTAMASAATISEAKAAALPTALKPTAKVNPIAAPMGAAQSASSAVAAVAGAARTRPDGSKR